MVLTKFGEHFYREYQHKDKLFLEENARFLFLTFIRPIINGTGNYYVEARTRNAMRTDIVVDYAGKQYIIELKIWHGEAYNSKGEKQLLEYMNVYDASIGYLVSFCFNKNKKSSLEEKSFDDKKIIELVI